jgi:predicted Zn-dependent peptidase
VNLGLGNEFDYDGPMLLTTRTTYKPGVKADAVIGEIDAVIADLVAKGVTEKELADAKVRFRSSYYDQLESGFGKANLLSSFALFRDDPGLINTSLQTFENVTAAQVKAARRSIWSRRTEQSSTAFRKPSLPLLRQSPDGSCREGETWRAGDGETRRRTERRRYNMKILLSISLSRTISHHNCGPTENAATPGAARPNHICRKITEKKLANGLTVVLAPLPNVPKITSILAFKRRRYCSRSRTPPGISQIAASVANEGTDARTSKALKEELRSIGGTLSLGSDTDSSSISASALSEFSREDV